MDFIEKLWEAYASQKVNFGDEDEKTLRIEKDAFVAGATAVYDMYRKD